MRLSDDNPDTCRNTAFGQDYRLDIGVLDVHNPRTSAGKKVMTWDFKPKGCDRDYQIEIAYHMDDDGRMYFKATNATLGVSVHGTDIESMRQEVAAELILKSTDIKDLSWEDWLEVSVGGSGSRFNLNPHTGMGAELKIHVKRLKRGWHEPAKRYVTINMNGLVVPFPEAVEQQVNTGSLGWLTGRASPQTAYIPDTPENRAALDDIQDRMMALQNRLADILHQDAIHSSIKRLDAFQIPDKKEER